MPQLDTKALSTEVAGTINRALMPLLERVAALEAKMAPLGDVRDRLVAVETKAALLVVPSLDGLIERLAALESKTATFANDRDLDGLSLRVAAVETSTLKIAALESKCCESPMSADQPEERRLVSMLERLSTLEYAIRRAESHESEIADLKARLAAAEAVAGQYAEIATQARQLVDRITAVEAKAGTGIDPVKLATDFAEFRAAVGALSDLPKDIGVLRERVAVVEVRQPVPGPAGKDGSPGKDGKDGADGLGFSDLSVVQGEDERTFVFQGERDGRVKALGSFIVPAQIYRGVWNEGQGYVKGDCVTWAGSEWHCNEPTVLKPGEGTKAWTLKVKRGRDGRDGRDAEPPAPVVRVK